MTEITAETMAGPRKPLLKRLAPVLVPVLAAAGFTHLYHLTASSPRYPRG